MRSSEHFFEPIRCKKCGGRCCSTYLDVLDGGTKPTDCYLEECVENWDQEFKHTGADQIEPLFDPLEVHKLGNENLKKKLVEKGIDPNKCKYCGIKGCIIPWKLRPNVCKEFRCHEWRANDPD